MTSSTLPPQHTSFVGRERELRDLASLLDSWSLVTLVGAGGCGKTRLALAAATNCASGNEFEDGVWWVDLAHLSDDRLIPQAIAAAMGASPLPGQDLSTTLVAALEDRRCLLVVDNCEHVVDPCRSLFGALLNGCRDLKILATSRELLRVPGETAFQVLPLTIPPVQPDSDSVRRSEAVRLFVERATAVYPRFELTPENEADVANVCRKLDGIALAVELAAVRVRVLTTRQIADRLDDCLQLPTRSAGSPVPHHETLHSAIEWSYGLLTEHERALLRRTAVFEGGFTLRAAEAVCDGDPVERHHILDLLTELLDKSVLDLFERTEGGNARYRLLEPIRQFAEEKLGRSGESARARNKHFDHYLQLTDDGRAQLSGAERPAALERQRPELGNIRAATRWCREGDCRAKLGLRLAFEAWELRAATGYSDEAAEDLEYFLSSDAHGGDEKLRASSLAAAGNLAQARGDFLACKRLHEESLAINESLGDNLGIANGLTNVASTEAYLGHYELARPLYKRSLELFRELGSETELGVVLGNIGTIALYHGDLATAHEQLTESIEIAHRVGNTWQAALSQVNCGATFQEQGEFEAARSMYDEGLRTWSDMGDDRCCAYAHLKLGSLALERDDLESARGHIVSCNALLPDLTDRWVQLQAVEINGRLAMAGGLAEVATRLLAASQAERDRLETPPAPIEHAKLEKASATASEELGDSAFSAVWSAGRGLTLEEAIELALKIPAATAPRTALQAQKDEFGGLTARERQVAALLVHGLTNQEIANELSVSPRTAEHHVSKILSKLGFESRTQVSAWAVEKGLAQAPEDLDTQVGKL